MRRLSIRTKLFATLLVAAVLAVTGTQAFVHWSFLRGLEEMTRAREQEQIARIGERLVARYEGDGSWELIRRDRRLWLQLVLEDTHMPPWLRRALAESDGWPPDSSLLSPPGQRALHPRPGPAAATQGTGPPVPEPDAAPRPHRGPPTRPLALRLMLLDADGQILYGRPESLAEAGRYPLELDGEQIGTLALLPGPSLSDAAQRRFRQRQGEQLWVIALGMLVLAALLALPAAALLTRPVTALQRTARRLADGDYQARAPVGTRDELGRLAQDLNLLAETLASNQEARRRWVADIAHELRTPLGLLRANLEAIQDGVRQADTQTLASLLDDVMRLGRLVDDLNELSRTEPSALAYRLQPVDLNRLLGELIAAEQERFARDGLSLSYAAEGPGPWRLQADPDRLAQLVQNLLSNSLAYTDPGQPVCVRLSRGEQQLQLEVDDGPPGLPDEALPLLFERLYRVEASRNRRTGGAGLGLAIVRNIVEAHGGRISAEHSPLGGLKIRILLPEGEP
jgi:two-component system sensor histidine kinase BaeS